MLRFLKTIEVLSQFLDKSENNTQRQKVIYTITSYIKLTRILADIEEHGLNKRNRIQLSMTLLRMFVIDPNSKKMKLSKTIWNIKKGTHH